MCNGISYKLNINTYKIKIRLRMKENNQPKQVFNDEYLNSRGLNIHAVINIKNLPEDVVSVMKQDGIKTDEFNQIILLGHLGKSLWKNIKSKGMDSENPIDEFAVKAVDACFQNQYPDLDYEVIYPGETVIGLQQLGRLVGWHNDSPFKVGINEKWGSWFAYRAVVLAKSAFIETKSLNIKSPCVSCTTHVCVSACPAHALDTNELDFNQCINYRKQENSKCKNTCLARVSCPVGDEYRYTEEQINYHYSVSMKTIEALY